jgi:Carboxypeptidase regulatory-like domain
MTLPMIRFARSVVALGIALGARLASAQVTTTISGTVYDSVGQRRLAGALVQIAHATRPAEVRSVETAADGSFRFDQVPTGTWLLGFFHTAVDSLGLPAPMLRVSIADSTAVRAMLATPSPQTIVRQRCGRDSTTLWMGRVRDARSGAYIDSATVVAQWTVIATQGGTISRQTPGVVITTDGDGRFDLCHLPADEMVVLRAWKGNDSTGTSMLAMPSSRLLLRDLFIAPAQVAQRAVPDESSTRAQDSVVVPVLVGVARVQGRVTRADGRPVRGARVRLSDAGAEATTNADGFYALDSLPLGTRLLDARAIGFLPVTRIVDLLPTTPIALDVVLESRQAFLDTVKVVGDRMYESPQYREFLQRKRSGFGYYADEQDLERYDPLYLSDILRRYPGITVRGTAGNAQVFMRSAFMQGGGGLCTPVIFLDGAMLSAVQGFSPDFLVPAQQIRGVEVYTRASGMPAQFQTMSGCGSIAVWTGPRRLQLPP